MRTCCGAAIVVALFVVATKEYVKNEPKKKILGTRSKESRLFDASLLAAIVVVEELQDILSSSIPIPVKCMSLCIPIAFRDERAFDASRHDGRRVSKLPWTRRISFVE